MVKHGPNGPARGDHAMSIAIVHLIAGFCAVAHQHGYLIHQSHGPGGWVLWTQPKHGMSRQLGVIGGRIESWIGRMPARH